MAGCVSGPKGVLVMVQDALKKPWPAVPARLKADPMHVSTEPSEASPADSSAETPPITPATVTNSDPTLRDSVKIAA